MNHRTKMVHTLALALGNLEARIVGLPKRLTGL